MLDPPPGTTNGAVEREEVQSSETIGAAVSAAIAQLRAGRGTVVHLDADARGTALLDQAERLAADAGIPTLRVDRGHPLDTSRLYDSIADSAPGAATPRILITVAGLDSLAPASRALVAVARPKIGPAAAAWIVHLGEPGDPGAPDDAAPDAVTTTTADDDHLFAAALLGRPIDAADLAAALDRPVASLLPFFRRAMDAGILVEDDSDLRFADPRVRRRVLSDAVGDAVRSADDLHDRVVRRLIDAGKSAALADGVRTGVLTLDRLEPAGAVAACELMSASDPATAAVALTRVLGRLPASDLDAVAARAATFSLQSGVPTAYGDYAGVLDGGAGPALTFAVAEATFAAVTQKARAAVAPLLAGSGLTSADRARLSGLALVADTYRGLATDAQRHDVDALVHATGDARAEGLRRLAEALFEAEEGDLGAALRAATLPMPLPWGADQGPVWWMAAVYRTRLLADLGRTEDAEAVLTEAVAAAHRAGQAQAIPPLMMMTGILRMDAGRLAAAAVHAEGALQLGEGMQLPGLVSTNCANLLTHVYRMTGDLVRLQELRAALQRGLQEDDARAETAARALAFADDALGFDRPAAAAGEGTAGGGNGGKGASRTRHYWIARGLSDVISTFRFAFHGADRASALRHFASIELLSRTTESILLRAAVRHCSGLLDGDAGAIREAQATYLAIGRRLLAAQAGEDVGLATSAPPAREDALHAAAATWTELGAHREAARIAQLLRTMGSRARADDSSLGLGLTAAQERVAQAVLAGATNEQVARALFLSPNTVSVHLSRIYAKVGVRSRGELIDLIRSPDPARGAGR
ncbi:LuxR C-terminal-related transcriptional regulator [Microbacterium invictum]|uniref:DNA-binding CsgD family transcriptional regulator n=1 Tax=Microbacterium invictum TaxID=515415 RepID=A0AA40VMW2_9MICO|nr:LuxR C-terminal-related transcriptional regulator [Microbacterium invictum]MBB4140849.1 DNA-binding CsgD family transcriptional regulator [Microbacterium invictum]